MERRWPVDLLADRTAESLAAWLRAHPGVEIIARDRASDYATGARAGAPAARQVADRWHLLGNLTDALVRYIQRITPELRRLLAADPPGPRGESPGAGDTPPVVPAPPEQATAAAAPTAEPVEGVAAAAALRAATECGTHACHPRR